MAKSFHENLETGPSKDSHCITAARSSLCQYEVIGGEEHKAEAIRQLCGIEQSCCIVAPLDGTATPRILALGTLSKLLIAYEHNGEENEWILQEALSTIAQVWADWQNKRASEEE
jgi:hypothetical protein